MGDKIFLKRYVQQSLACGAQEAIDMIEAGRVEVDGKLLARPLQLVSPCARVALDGKELAHVPVKKLYYLLNKPSGVLCQPDKDKKTIFDYIEALDVDDATRATLFNVGRLDFDTEGLLIITNDGSFSKRIMEPSKKVPKTYETIVTPCMRPSSLANLRKGITISLEGKGSYITEPANIDILEHVGKEQSRVRITITEGKKRQIRKMLSNQGYTVLKLVRVAIGNLHLGALRPGMLMPISYDTLIKSIYGGKNG